MSEPSYAVDTSVAVPLLVRSHEAHQGVVAWARGKRLCLSGQAAVETYSVLTRLPGAQVSGADAVRVMDDTFAEVLALPATLAADIHRELAQRGIAGGAAYDGLVALAAREHGLTLATRDARARGTYETVGALVCVVASTAS